MNYKERREQEGTGRGKHKEEEGRTEEKRRGEERRGGVERRGEEELRSRGEKNHLFGLLFGCRDSVRYRICFIWLSKENKCPQAFTDDKNED